MKDKNINPGRSIGIFLIILGLFMSVIMLDVLGLGSTGRYFIWPMLLVFIGLVSFFNRNPVGGLILIAIGVFFLLPRLNIFVPDILEKIYWPAAIFLVGLVFIISGIVKRNRRY